MDLKDIFDRLWTTYTGQNPHVQQVFNLFTAAGETVVNDHIAFRTFNDPRINVDVLARVFLEAGYTEKGRYRFEEKKLFARHFEHPSGPRVFISELLMEEFSPELQATIRMAIDRIPPSLLQSEELIFSGNTWGPVSYDTYQQLLKESEYAAWVYVFGFCANHFTVSVNSLKKFDTIQKVNQYLKDNGFRLNDSGGEIKGNPAELLEQSSTRSGVIAVDFREGRQEIPGCYYEFALRYTDENGELFSGFIAKSADKIFESTNFYTKR